LRGKLLNLKNIWRIALFETKKARSVTKQKIVIVTVILAALIYFSTTFLVESGFTSTESFYTIYTENDQIKRIIQNDERFILVEDSNADIIVEVSDKINVFSSGNDRSRAALYYFEQSLKHYNRFVVEEYEDSLAYPVRVDLDMLERDDISMQEYMELTEQEQISQNGGVRVQRAEKTVDLEEKRMQEALDREAQPSNIQTDGEEINLVIDDEFQNVDEELSSGLVSQTEQNRPDDLNPFDQLRTLFLVIFMTIPVSMISVIFSNSFISEKINKRGIFFLVSPVKAGEVIIGKVLPYLASSYMAGLLIILSATTVFKEVLMSSIIFISILIVYLAIGFLCAMLSRSHKELSFLSIFFISLYSCYLLIPSFMVNISFISLASPLSVIVKLFQHETIGLKLFLFSVIPTLIAGLSMFVFGSKLFNDEDMFSYKSIKNKIVSALAAIVNKPWQLGLISFFSVPFVYLIELMILVFLLGLRFSESSFLFIFFAALTEEFLRNSGIYAILKSKKFSKKAGDIFKYAVITGLGFFIAEKSIFFITITPFLKAYSYLNLSFEIPAFGFIIGSLIASVFTVLIIHIFLSFVFGMLYKKYRSFGVALLISSILHFLINVTTQFVIMSFVR
jgi:hypothetical protein